MKTVDNIKMDTRLVDIKISDISTVWNMYEKALFKDGPAYPDVSKEDPAPMREQILDYITGDKFRGALATVGDRPAGLIMGDIRDRAFGTPKKYFYIFGIWIEADFRHQNVGHALFGRLQSIMRNENLTNWESFSTDEKIHMITKAGGVKVNRHAILIGGEI